MKKYIIFSLAFWAIGLTVKAQTRYYVNQSATGGNSGQSWADAFSDLTIALDAAQPGDTLWVAEGTYWPTTSTDRTVSFLLKSGVRMYGGFVGSETVLSQRDWLANPVLLSGDIGISGDSTDNAYTILYMDNPDSLTVLDGFEFRYGIANYTPTNEPALSPYKCGGAVYIMAQDGAGYATVQNCHFANNYAHSYGGALCINGSGSGTVAPLIKDCIFEYNLARLDGGGLYRNGGSWVERVPDFSGCLFQYNRANRRGGGLYYTESERIDRIDVYDCRFLNNSCNNSGGGATFGVGRVTGTNISMHRCEFEGNNQDSGSQQGEALALNSFSGLDMGEMELDGCTFRNNGPGTVIWFDVLYGNFNVKSCLFKDTALSGLNLGGFDSSTLYKCDFENWSLVLTKYVLIKNSSFTGDNPNFITSFGVVDSTRIFNNLFIHNGANRTTFNLDSGKKFDIIGSTITGAHQILSVTSNTPEVTFSNCIFHKWDLESTIKNGSEVTFDHCLFKDNSFCSTPPAGVTCGPGNLFNLDPMFRDTANGDYSLLPCSPLINAGSNAAAAGILTDLAGNPRILEGTVDIGAYEAPAFALAAAPTVSPACVGADGGSIALQPINGCEPYTYDWMPNAGTGPELNGLPAGAYQITLTDASGRQIMDTVLVPEAPQPNVSLATAHVVCGNPAGGSLTAVVNNGTGPFSYQWLPTAADTFMLKNLPAGAYSLTLTDANGCQDSTSASIALMGALTLSVDGKAIPCYGETGWLSATPLNGAAPFSWLWSGWAGTDSLAQPLTPGNYAVTVSDAYGCTSTFAFPTMTQPDSLSIGTGSDPQSQINPPNGLALVTTISGGTSPFTFDWSPFGMTQAITGLEAGTYTVTVSDKNGCTATAVVVVDFTIGTQNIDNQVLVVFPNPAADWVRVLLPSGAWQVELLDAGGRVLRTRACEGENCVFDLEGLAAGWYGLRAWNGEKIWLGRVVKR